MELKFIRYSRKSDEAKERQEYSISDQNKECEIYANSYLLQLSSQFKLEEEKSAFKPNKRPIFDEMIRLIKSGEANAILCWKENRLCRNPEEGGKLLQMLQDGIIKEIRIVSTNSIYTQESDHLILQIQFGMANQFSRNLSKDVRRGLYRKATERKQYPFPAPIGFEGFGEPRNRNIRPHPIEAPFILKAFQLASTGIYSLGNITDILFNDGFRTKKENKVGKSQIFHILSTPTYYGYFYIRGELCEGKYEPIISKVLFDLVQEKLKDRSKPKLTKWEKDFSGLIHCGKCGCAITTTIKRKFLKKKKLYENFIYHHCTHRRGNCFEKPITDFQLKEMLYSKLDRMVIDKEVWQLGLELLKGKYKNEIDKNKHQLEYSQTQTKQIREQVNRLIEMRASEELTKEEFLEQKNRLLNKLSDLENKIKDNSNSFKTWLELIETFFDTAFQARDVVENGTIEQKRKVLTAIGENFLLTEKKLTFSFKKPFDVLLKPEYRSDLLPD